MFIELFDGKANVTAGIINQNTNFSDQFLLNKKYYLMMGHEHHLAGLIAGFSLPHEYRTLPMFGSSFLFEFY